MESPFAAPALGKVDEDSHSTFSARESPSSGHGTSIGSQAGQVPVSLPKVRYCGIFQSFVTAATIRCTMPSIAAFRYQCQTNTTSCWGSIQMVFEPLPRAAKLDAGPFGH